MVEEKNRDSLQSSTSYIQLVLIIASTKLNTFFSAASTNDYIFLTNSFVKIIITHHKINIQ